MQSLQNSAHDSVNEQQMIIERGKQQSFIIKRKNDTSKSWVGFRCIKKSELDKTNDDISHGVTNNH